MGRLYLPLLMLIVACSHDSARENPLDPGTTPVVALTAAVDDTAGTVTLTWSAYEGGTEFSEYLVLRKEPGLEAVDTLAAFSQASATSYIDSEAELAVTYSYRVSVVNQAGLEVSSQAQEIRPLRFLDIAFTQSTFDSGTATATLAWTPYRGPRFAAYVLRRTAGLTTEILAQIDDISRTSFEDSGLRGDTEYFYSVDVRTQAGEEIRGDQISGSIHSLVGSWSLDLAGDAGSRRGESLRLYHHDGTIQAFITGNGSTRLVEFDTSGTEIGLRDLLSTDICGAECAMPSNRAAAFTTDSHGRLWTSVVDNALSTTQAQFVGLLRSDEVDGAATREVSLFEDLLASLPERALQIGGEIRLRGTGSYRDVAVVVKDRTVFEEDFADFPTSWRESTVGDWEFTGPVEFRTLGGLIIDHLRDPVYRATVEAGTGRRRDPSWENYYVQVALHPRLCAIEIGTDSLSSLSLTLEEWGNWGGGRGDRVHLDWSYVSATGETDSLNGSIGYPMAGIGHEGGGASIFGQPLAYQVELGEIDGRLTARLRDPFWFGTTVPADENTYSTTLVSDGEDVLLTAGERAYFVTSEGTGQQRTSFDSWVGETRLWQVQDERFPRVGVVLPDEDRLEWGVVPSMSRWAESLNRTAGPRLAEGVLPLFNPVSLAAASDGRMYVVDAGNARIVALDQDGNYITEWGTRGPEAGSFEFGSGDPIYEGRSYAGSIAVDDEGFIYVADVGNRRIQKFAP